MGEWCSLVDINEVCTSEHDASGTRKNKFANTSLYSRCDDCFCTTDVDAPIEIGVLEFECSGWGRSVNYASSVTRPQSSSDLGLVCDVHGVKWDIVISLDDVEHRNGVPAVDELLHDVATDESAATNNTVNVRRHWERMFPRVFV